MNTLSTLSLFSSLSISLFSETQNFLWSIFLPLLLLEESLIQLISGVLGYQDLWFSGVKIERKMNYRGYQQKNAMRSCDEMRMESVVCPKPRRFGLMNHSFINNNNNHIRPYKPQIISYQSELEDSGVKEDLLDIILPKRNSYMERFGDQMASSPPPFFCGSPPSRASNPVIQDEQFGNSNGHGNFSPFSMAPSSPSSSARSCVPMKFGHAQAAVRIEGFDCLNRDRRNRSISAVA